MKKLRLNVISRNVYDVNSMSYPKYNNYQQWRIMVLRKGLSSISIYYIDNIIHQPPMHLYLKTKYCYLNYKDNDIKYYTKNNNKRFKIRFLPKKNISLDDK